jgi:hypothetical protein
MDGCGEGEKFLLERVGINPGPPGLIQQRKKIGHLTR